MRLLLAIGIVASLAFTAQAQSKNLVISHEAYAAYQDYLAALPKNGEGIFLVSDDGTRWGYFICREQHCGIGSMIALAASQCVDETHTCGKTLAWGRQAQDPFEVAR